MHRRKFLKSAAALGLVSATASCRRPQLWRAEAYRKKPRSLVSILRAPSYDIDLVSLISQCLKTYSLPVEGRRVMLKPNPVEYERETVINTNPAIVGAAIEAFRQLGASAVLVGEGPGHRRDTDGLLVSSGLVPFLKATGAEFVDLNLDETRRVRLNSGFMGVDSLYFPKSVLECDLLVSMPKIKTHHWVGMTLSLKNLFGIIPGVHYGWPKNFLHWRGIHESIVDINSTVHSHFVIADGVVCMEGNGPIQGKPKPCGVVVMGDDPVAVDATCARIAGLRPERIEYLEIAGQFLGNLDESNILQIGEPISAVQSLFDVIGSFTHLKS